MNKKEVILIGYSGHSYVVYDIFRENRIEVIGYCDKFQKKINPFRILYLGDESNDKVVKKIRDKNYFVAIGDNKLRKKIANKLKKSTGNWPINAIDGRARISPSAFIKSGVMVAPGCTINALARIEEGVICNTHSIIEHECDIGAYSHIAPGAVLCGNVKVGSQTFIGARTVIKQGVKIGSNVIIGAGTVIIKNIPDGCKVAGNPQRNI